MKLRGAFLATLLMMGAACGPHLSTPAGEVPTPSPSTTPSPAAAYPSAQVLTDPTGTLHVKVGDQFTILLTKLSGFAAWGPVVSQSDNVRPLYPPAATGSAFEALDAGSAVLSASTSPQCKPPTALPSGEGYACPALARIWTLNVEIAAGTRGPAAYSIGSGPRDAPLHAIVGDRLTVGPDLSQLQIQPGGILDYAGVNPDRTQTMVAVGAGTAVVTGVSQPPCLKSHPPCMVAQMEYRLEVTVVVGPA